MTRRDKTYALLARLHNQQMEAQAGQLVSLQGTAAQLEAERAALEESRRAGASVTMIEAMPYRGQFLTTIRRENLRISNQLHDIEKRIEAQRDKVLECYRDARSAELLGEEARSVAQLAAQETAQAEADEMVLLRRIAGER
ncbi:hypothetical protein [Psychromarinibacter sp. S121]|uniref:hypothetical protein n=1 Tax=Psychromarinibacter sp. S121 TaxID=3415127 RepID=UPI003C7E4776